GVLVYRLDDQLFFANASYVKGRVREALHGAPAPVRWFVFPSSEGPAGSRPRPKVDAGRLWTGGVATAAVNLAIGAAIGSLVSSIARSAVRVVNA
ncbi:MAG TPA: hypothetical protein VG409_03390, partial [Actinomycetota bacterium]|nr:hypothetical protein [Actinomycetota bacterium]